MFVSQLKLHLVVLLAQLAAPEYSAHLTQQDIHRAGFGQVVVATKVISFHYIFYRLALGQKQYRHFAAHVTYIFEQLKSVFLGHIDVQ